MIDWAAQALLGSALVMAILLALRVTFVWPLGGARAAYVLWALVPLRLVLPPLPAPTSAGPVAVPFEIVAGAAASAPAPALAGADWLVPLWLGGAGLFAAWQAFAYRRFVARALADAAPFGTVDGIPVLSTPAVAGPAAIGPFCRRILVPADFGAWAPAERELALAHEARHHARGDLCANLLALGLLALHWFNPLAWAAHRAFRRDQEVACDAAVIGAAGPDRRLDYGRALARAAGALPPSPATTLGEANMLKRRLDMLMTHRARTSGLAKIGTAALGALALGLTATGSVAQTSGENVTVKRIEIKTDESLTAAEREARIKAAIREQIGDRCKGELEAFGAARAGANTTEGAPLILTCGGVGENRLARLESVRERLSTRSELTDENRAKAMAALDAAIAQERARR